jgi:hypothetical protein
MIPMAGGAVGVDEHGHPVDIGQTVEGLVHDRDSGGLSLDRGRCLPQDAK